MHGSTLDSHRNIVIDLLYMYDDGKCICNVRLTANVGCITLANTKYSTLYLCTCSAPSLEGQRYDYNEQ